MTYPLENVFLLFFATARGNCTLTLLCLEYEKQISKKEQDLLKCFENCLSCHHFMLKL